MPPLPKGASVPSADGSAVSSGARERVIEQIRSTFGIDVPRSALGLVESEPRPTGAGGDGVSTLDLDARRRRLFEEGSPFQSVQREEIVGVDPLLERIDQVASYLRHLDTYAKLGARTEPGILLSGTPGTGKTTAARYLASRAGALFINVRDWPHVGALFTEADIAALFTEARRVYADRRQPIILFWDEFETAAKRRDEATPEQAATVSQLTAELDGVQGKSEGILLVGCTNYVADIDQALKRPGRMGIQLRFEAPERRGKLQLLEHYLSKYPVVGEADIETISYLLDTNDSAAAIEEAVMTLWSRTVATALQDGVPPKISATRLLQFFVQRMVGEQGMQIHLTPEQRRAVAVHEAGHGIAALAYHLPIRIVTVQPGEDSLGRVVVASREEHTGTVGESVDLLRFSLAARSAELVGGYPASDGAADDIYRANRVATYLVERQGHGERMGVCSGRAVRNHRGAMGVGVGNGWLSPATALLAEQDVRDLLRSAERDVDGLMRTVGRERLHAIAAELVERVTLSGTEFTELSARVLGTDDFTSLLANEQ